MHFEYEISFNEFVAAQHIYRKLSRSQKRAVDFAFLSGLTGLIFVSFAWRERSLDLEPIFFALMGVAWIYFGIAALFPTRSLRRAYQKGEFAGKTFKVDANEDGFEVTGDLCSWRVRWLGVRLKGEDDRVFMLCSSGTIFMFGKKYLNIEQQQELRRLSGLNLQAPQIDLPPY